MLQRTLDDTLGDGPRAGEARPLRRGESIGRFVIIDRVGSGGMGVVYSAYDPELDRKVAIKLLHRDLGRGTMASAGRIKLIREAQALARVSHSNVVGVHDVGEHEGNVFLALEFVEGRTLGAWLREEEPPTSEVLRVLVDAGRGLVAAHAAGILHRDFKPDNVLVGVDGRVRVTDFGLAQDLERPFPERRDPWTSTPSGVRLRAEARRGGAGVGTPAYMAPEQYLGLELDARCDQFSFCVTLWEALVGQRPFRHESVSGLAFNVIEGVIEEPPAGTTAPAWVLRVLRRGLQRRPESRYESMAELLEALARDPAIARRRWMRRGGAATFGGAVVAAAFLALQSPRPEPCEGARDKLAGIWDDARRAELEEAVLGTELPYAESSWARVAPIVDRYAERWVEAHEDACRATMVRGEQSDGLMDARIRCLDRRRGALAAFGEQLGRVDAKAVERAVQAAEGLPGLARCDDVEYVTKGPSPRDDPERFAEIERIEVALDEAEATMAAGRFSEALALARHLQPRVEALAEPSVWARARFVLGRALSAEGSWLEAEPVLHEAFAAAREADDEVLVADVATSLVFLIGRRLARHVEGLAWVEHAEVALRKAPSAMTRVRLLNAAGGIHLREEDAHAALEHYEQALRLAEQELPQSYNHGLSLNNVALAYEDLGEFDRALEHLTRSREVFTEALGPGHPRTAMPLANTASIHFRRGEYERAVELGEQVLAIREPVLPPSHPSLAHTLNNLGNALHFAGRSREALLHLRRAHRAVEGRLGGEHPDVAMCLSNLAMVHRSLGHTEEALAANRRALEIRSAAYGPEHPTVATSHNNLASALHQAGDTAGALEQYERALAIYEKAYGVEHPTVGHPLTGIGQMLLALERPRDAIAPLERALALRADGAPLELADTEYALARALRGAGRDPERARALGESARDRYAEASGPSAEENREAIEQWLEGAAASP